MRTFLLATGVMVLCSGCQTGWLGRMTVDECYQGPEPGSDAWWDHQAMTPPGARQVCRKGKAWPPFPRPTGPRAQLSHQYHHNHYWPHPYNCQDRAVVQAHLNAQINAGWREATTLFEYHFDGEEQKLNRNGERHLRWLVHHAPPQYRVVYVQEGDTPERSQQRLENVRTYVATIVRGEDLPPIELRYADTPGRDAEELNRLRLRDLETIPDPQLPIDVGGSGTNSGAAAAGAAAGASN